MSLITAFAKDSTATISQVYLTEQLLCSNSGQLLNEAEYGVKNNADRGKH